MREKMKEFEQLMADFERQHREQADRYRTLIVGTEGVPTHP
jgi:hypothetical protein